MAQVKVFALKSTLENHRRQISDAIHEAVMMALEYPPEKRFHRFFPMEVQDFIYPDDRSEQYLIIEILMFEGRSDEAKKQLLKQLMQNLQLGPDIAAQDIEITILESPQQNWGIRGLPGDELALNYKVEV